MNTFNQTAKSLDSKRRGIFLISFIAAFSFTLLTFEYARFDEVQSQHSIEDMGIYEPFIEEDQIRNIVFEMPAPIMKVAKANKIIVVEEIPVKRSVLDIIDKITPPDKTIGLFSSIKNGDSKLKMPKKEKIVGFNEIKLANFPCFKNCELIENPIERYKCTQLAISEYLLGIQIIPLFPENSELKERLSFPLLSIKKEVFKTPKLLGL